jgi:hypothetical protein
MISKQAIVVSVVFVLSGCVVGQKIEMDYSATPTAVTEANSVSISVVDARPYVVNGDKEPSFIGKYRAGFGNPWDVTTENNVPLAELLAGDIEEAVRSLGFGTQPTDSDRSLTVQILDWNFDAYVDGRFWYELDVEVTGSDNAVITSLKVKDAKHIDGSFWTGAKSAFEEQMPGFYKEVVSAIVTDNQEVQQALRS